MQYIYVFISGAIGAFIRYILSILNHGSVIPFGTIIANLLGAFFMGFIGSFVISYFKKYPIIKKGLTTGFLGALTTFSTFQFELVTLFEQQHFIVLLVYGLTSYLLGVLLCYVGVTIGGKLS
ncbi:fluoride efflux transporter CrcB [Staphylococcus saccharolyticus]|mgnify:FL=1|uniref:Fluoride-specific ion channel FluC n=1 Tax=Staphylococcus saccharolyticus TaxID=33028 RepID=A0A380H1P1_9STAP|nr:fluoride efflux transporter CrcB [Staphylococcus saccharolyticus]MBL7564989.1 fluoride efflux transporter CrcB [Staphylococcus saccharolyticus]MBL7571974.1 fluoride efflux transporter CrcB [Staphylococcus saccharolyticus]QQB98455.1 fluoride efflux transporter CrcB [Staphylococcus saccharolyticus]QRJ67329.1 fluoride efflux transporter CrcB [Staphylococcus saccharolyticus]RTX97780.1 fluoride efflux transporter CrcB [Staphylococcus saccharolyticus]